MMNIRTLIMMMLSLVFLGLLAPIGIGQLIGQVTYGGVEVNGTTYGFTTLAGSVVVTLLTYVLPIVICVAIIIYYVPKLQD